MTDAQHYTVRLATPDDAEALSAIATRTFVHLAETVHKEDIMPDDLTNHVAKVLSAETLRGEIQDPKRTTLFIFPQNDYVNPCGFAMIGEGNVRPGDEGAAADDYLEVKRVYVDIPYVGKGTAQVLMENVMQLIKQKNRKIVWVGTGVRNLRAQRFYNKFGFVLSGKRYFTIGNVTHHDLVLTLQDQ